eukprot:CAMPEP_0176226826 /NCGR_PEP_ID=MMETSP0121_2-20121125/22456_1 /TAXON_ID=160619 /ORGANISM="Kryptoperidinium foliaceum, Strain CCMP 1326" /LENGTH=231 /DNA_ID=CAMNT_0017566095 /DNA_START=29 /DNA_END=722 /DNA_ORIENTATION=-
MAISRPVGHSGVRKRLKRFRVYGDSNAVGYRRGPFGTRGYLEQLLQARYDVERTIGRTGLTILPSRSQFLPWAKAKFGEDPVETDFALVVLGTNDISHLWRAAMEWSLDASARLIAKYVRRSLRAILRWVAARTAKRVFVLEPVHETPSKAESRRCVVQAMREEVREFGEHVVWLQMGWGDADLQTLPGRAPDGKHFNGRGCERVVALLEAGVQRGGDAGLMRETAATWAA